MRNFRKAGLGESESMSISGHETNSTYKRYGIIDENLQRESLERVHEQQQREMKSEKSSRSGERDELGQLSDKKTGIGVKAKLIYVGQALNWCSRN